MLSICIANTGNVVLKTNFGWREREGERERTSSVWTHSWPLERMNLINFYENGLLMFRLQLTSSDDCEGREGVCDQF